LHGRSEVASLVPDTAFACEPEPNNHEIVIGPLTHARRQLRAVNDLLS
jgi:hypothetical protein